MYHCACITGMVSVTLHAQLVHATLLHDNTLDHDMHAINRSKHDTMHGMAACSHTRKTFVTAN